MMSRFKKLTISAAMLVALSACGERATAPEAPAPSSVEPIANEGPSAIRMLADDHAKAVLSLSPEYATFLGVSEEIAGEGYLGRLGAYGFSAHETARSQNETFLQEIRSIDRENLAEEERVTYDVLRAVYEIGARRNQFDFGGATPWGYVSPYPVTQLTGAHLMLPRLMLTQQPLETEQHAEYYISRLSEVGRAFDELIESIGSDAALGVTPPDFALTGAVNSIAGFTAPSPADNPLSTHFQAKLADIETLSEEQRAALNQRAQRVVEEVVYPAYARLSATLDSLLAQTNSHPGIWRLGDEGAAYYQLALDAYGANGMTAEEIHALGLAEVERITAQMDEILQEQGLVEGGVIERYQSIAQMDGMLYPNTDEGRATLLADLNTQTQEILARAPDWFGAIPGEPVEVRRIPIYEQDTAPGGYYTSPPLDGTRPGIYWINLKNTADWPKHTLKTLTYHEAVPGHHFQIALSQNVGLPMIHSMMGLSEYAEGWALYAEKVAVEMGMYDDDPFGDLGRLQAELYRAARLVIDTGLHAKRWTREQAVEYMINAAGAETAEAKREIDRYSVWPGQACSYKLGMIAIENLRAEAEAALGEAFDIRAFHDALLLTGARPLPVLEKDMRAWIAAQQG